ncbi:MAG: hypothetical protein J7K12_04195 [Thermoplasmata archaeon]|nr:hypothetical protein [Thermoplasmata archaeon]
MRLFVGSFDEEEVNEIVEDLRKAGVRSDLRHALDIDIEEKYYIEGKISELKEKYKEREDVMEIINDVEDYFEKARQVMEEGIDVKQFEEKFLDEVLPERKEFEEIRKELKEAKKEKNLSKMYKELVEKFGKEKTEDFFDQFMYELKFMSMIHSLLEKNGVKYKEGKMYGKIADDPYIKVYVGEHAEDLPYEMRIYVFKNVDVYVNLLDVLYETERIEKLVKKKNEYMPLLIAATIVGRIMDEIENKMELEELIEKTGYFKFDGDEIFLTEDAINEIIKTLEKGEIIRIKKGRVILKERKKRG